MIQHWTEMWLCNTEIFSCDESHTTASHVFLQWFSAAECFFFILQNVFSLFLRGILASSFKGCGQLSDVRCEVGVVCFVGICLVVCGAVRCCTSPAELFLATPSCVVTKPALYCAQLVFLLQQHKGVPGTGSPWWRRWGGSRCSRRRRERPPASG